EVRWLERTRNLGLVDPPPVAFYGSSSIRLWETLQEDFPGIGVVNLGFGGSSLAARLRGRQRPGGRPVPRGRARVAPRPPPPGRRAAWTDPTCIPLHQAKSVPS